MPLTVDVTAPGGDTVRAYARRMGIIDSRRSNLLRAFADRSFESDVMSAERTLIPNPTLPGKGSATTRTRNADWKATAGQPTQAFLVLAIDQSIEDAVELEYRDNIESPLNYLELNRRSMAAGLNTSIEDNIYAFLNTDSNFDSARSVEVGTRGTDNITPAGVVSGGVGEGIVQALLDISTDLASRNKLGPAMGDQIDRAPRGPVAVMHPQCFKAVATYLLAEKYPEIKIAEEVLDSISVRRREAYMGRLWGIDLYSSPVCAAPASASNTNKWNILIFSPDSWTYAERPPVIQYLTPETNQTGPSYLLREIRDFGRTLLDTSVLFRRQVHTN